MAIVYSSVTGNTKELAELIKSSFMHYSDRVELYEIHSFPIEKLALFNMIVVGTYTWGNGEIPKEMMTLFNAFEREGNKTITTGVFGTGDSFYPHFCGAVDKFRDMLYHHTNLAVTLKVELLPQEQDKIKCQKFAELVCSRRKCRDGSKLVK